MARTGKVFWDCLNVELTKLKTSNLFYFEINFTINKKLFFYSAELGDYDGSRHSRGYVSEFRFLATQSEDMEQRIEDIHRRLVGLQPAQAENR